MTAPAVTAAAPAAITQPAQPAVAPVPPERRADQYLDRLLSRHGTPEAAVRAVSIEKFTAEDARDNAERERDSLRARLPEGAMVLTKEAAASFAKLQALNLTPDQIIERIGKATALEAQVAQTDLEKLARTGAPDFKLDPDGLAAHITTKKLHAEMRDATVTDTAGQKTVKKVLHVRPAAEANAPLQPISEYVKTLAAHEQRALTAGPGTPVATSGVPHPVQTLESPAPTAGNEFASFKKQVDDERAGRPSPLINRSTGLPVTTQQST